MLTFISRRLGTMLLTMLCLTLVVFFMVNLEPNLRKLSISQLDMRSSDADIEQWLVKNGYRQNFFVRYGQWLGVVQKQPNVDPATGKAVPRFSYCNEPAEPIECRFHVLLLIAKATPAEVEGIAIQHDDIGGCQILSNRLKPPLSDRTSGEQVQIRKDNSSWHGDATFYTTAGPCFHLNPRSSAP